MDQHVRLGRLYRSHYGDFLPPRLHPQYFSLTTSPVDRCVRSAECFFLGLYPSTSTNEVLYFETASEMTSDMQLEGDRCPEIAQAKADFNNGPVPRGFVEQNYATLKPALDAVGLPGSVGAFGRLCGWAIAFNCSTTSTGPPWLTDAAMDVCQRFEALTQFVQFRDASSRGLFSSYIMRHVLHDAAVHIGTEKKMGFFSTHDTSLSAILASLGYTDSHVPLYASHIAIEYWEDAEGDIWVRHVFNGVPVGIDLFDGDNLVRYDQFLDVMRQFWDHCPNVGTWESASQQL
jgi:acid phosphatase